MIKRIFAQFWLIKTSLETLILHARSYYILNSKKDKVKKRKNYFCIMSLSTYWLICLLSLIVAVFTTTQTRMEHCSNVSSSTTCYKKIFISSRKIIKSQNWFIDNGNSFIFGKDAQFISNITKAFTDCGWSSVGFDNGLKERQTMIVTAGHVSRNLTASWHTNPARMNSL